jgi:hypothetical protein
MNVQKIMMKTNKEWLRATKPLLFPLFTTGVVDTGDKFATGVNNTSGTGGKICRRCQ